MTNIDIDETSELVSFPIQRTCPFAIPPVYTKFREEAPVSQVVLPDGGKAWLVTKYEDVRAVMSNPRLSSDRRKKDFPVVVPGQNAALAKHAPFMIILDGAEHAAARRPVISEFSVRRVAAMKPRIQEIVDHFIDEMLKLPRPVDLNQVFSLPVPSLVVSEILGMPYEGHEYFMELAEVLLRRTTDEQGRIDISVRLRAYMDKLVEEKIANPGDDLLSRQIELQRQNGGIDRPQLASLCLLVLLAGHETTANMINLGVFSMLTRPELLAEIKADPAKTPKAVDELLRFYTIPDFGAHRLAMDDVEIGGVLIRKGEAVIASTFAANRDPAVFDDPEELDFSRDSRHHVAFGYGPHQCLGQNLGRVELQVVFDTLFRRLPDLRLAVPAEELNFKSDALVYGLYELPVTW
ncbi:cytochrome P450 [Streptomyces sp. NPDC057280]|uniref:cytochrome P450 n=1 Tax=Streptomyces sp. NPDC057280 TaxID=3346081 RepID=UPI00362BDE13